MAEVEEKKVAGNVTIKKPRGQIMLSNLLVVGL